MELLATESEWRCHMPANAINAANEAGRSPHTARLFHMPTALDWRHPAVMKQLGVADVLMFQRNVILPEVHEAMRYWRAVGKVVLTDIDDAYQDLPPSNPAHAYWIRNRMGLEMAPLDAFAEGLRCSDALTSPSKVILEDWKHIVPGFWLPNYCRRAGYDLLVPKPQGAPDIAFDYDVSDPAKPQFRGQLRDGTENTVVIGWGGSISHLDSWLFSGVVEALDRLFEKWPQARLKFCGHESRLDYVFERWGDKVIRQTGVRPEHWPQVVGSFDVGLAPLDMRKLEPWREGAPVASYDERRSWLKGIEYLCAGVPWVGSKSATYNDLVRHGTLVDSTPEAWFKALDHKLTNLTAEKRLAWEKRTWALKRFTMEGNLGSYIDTLGRIAAQKTVAGGSRLPGVTYVLPTLSPGAV